MQDLKLMEDFHMQDKKDKASIDKDNQDEQKNLKKFELLDELINKDKKNKGNA